MSSIAPENLGRGIVVAPGVKVPKQWRKLAPFRIDRAVLARPQKAVETLHRHWVRRIPLVVELQVAAGELKESESCWSEPYLLDPSFEFWRERLHFLVWANNYDATRGEPIWWHARLAQSLGAIAHPEAEIDLDGPRWCDGGPRTTVPFSVVHRESIEEKQLALTHPLSPTFSELLDPEQLAAVTATAPSLRILAPAGSGKTRVLTSRLRHLLEHGYEPERISALAYNRRAAQQMGERVNQASSSSSIRTLHSLGYHLLRRFHPELTVANPFEVRAYLKELIRIPPQVNTDPLAPYLDALQTVRLGLVEPERLEQERDDIPGFAALFPRYRRRLQAARKLDYDEQIYSCIELLLQKPEARSLGRRLCTHLLVDEFQDLTPAFLLLLRLLAAPSYQVFGVGDDDQVIYGYAGATPDFLVDYASYFPAAESRFLKNNYRCPSGVVEAANLLLSRNQRRVRKEAVSASRIEAYPSILVTEQERWAERATLQIKEWLVDHPPEQIAVLARVNSVLMPLQVALEQAQVPHTKVVDEDLLERTGLRSALAYWRLCTQSWRAEDLYDALRRPNRKLRRELLDRAASCPTSRELQRLALNQDEWPRSQLEEFVQDLALLSQRAEKGPGVFFAALRQHTEFTTALDSLDASGLGAAGSSHRDDLIALEALASQCDSADFEGWLRVQLSAGESDDKGVRLSSVHRVKGLEWPCVLIFGAEEGLFPHRLSEDLEEERRVFHVALTRSERHCVLLATPQQTTRFVKEMVDRPAASKAKLRLGAKR